MRMGWADGFQGATHASAYHLSRPSDTCRQTSFTVHAIGYQQVNFGKLKLDAHLGPPGSAGHLAP